MDSDEEFMYPMQNPNIDTTRIDEIPAKEPKFNAVPLKSALKKKTSNPGTPTQDTHNKTLHERQANSSFKYVFSSPKLSFYYFNYIPHNFMPFLFCFNLFVLYPIKYSNFRDKTYVK